MFYIKMKNIEKVFITVLFFVVLFSSLFFMANYTFAATGSTWGVATYSPGWIQRWGHNSLVFNNKLWVIGGVTPYGSRNDVWYTSDGVNWVQARANGAARGFPARFMAAATVYGGKMWVFGGVWGGKNPGTNNSYKSDVWWSVDGKNWYQATSQAPWIGRKGHTATVFKNKMWIIGGRLEAGWPCPGGSGPYCDDVWFSTNGSSWSRATYNPGWTARFRQGTTVLNGRIYIMGGSNGGYLNDVWSSSNGYNWSRRTSNIGWTPRSAINESTLTYNNKIWVFGGWNRYGCGNGGCRDVWNSSNGVNWTKVVNQVGWTGMFTPVVKYFNNRFWVTGGYIDTGGSTDDVWYSDPVASVMSVNKPSGSYTAPMSYTATWSDPDVSTLSTCKIRIDLTWYNISCSGNTATYSNSFTTGGTHTLRMYSSNSAGIVSYSNVYTYNITVSSPIKLFASPNPINYGASSVLSWTSSGLTSCSASGAWSGSKPVNGSESTGALASNKTYTLNCTGGAGNSSDSITIIVLAPKACQDGVDSDGDGWIDYPADPGCSSPTDNNESNSGGTQCSDGIDNDRDGFIDGYDPNCTFPSDDSEFVDPDFSLSKLSDISITIVGEQQSDSGSATTTVNPNATFSSGVALSLNSITPPIPGASYTFSDNTLRSGEYSRGSSFTITVPKNTSAGAYTVSIKGKSLGISRYVNVKLNISFVNPSFDNF
jgi:hypothetical protein